jgi:hypothetical protein
VHDILTDLDGSEQRNTKYLSTPYVCISILCQVRNCQRPESHGSSTQCSTSLVMAHVDTPEMERGIAPERVVEVALPLLDLVR